jgi:DNA-binding response OmpR family regulator
MRQLLETIVTLLGHECLTASDGAEAWSMFEQHGADVVISDWMMPNVDGLELCQRVRASESQHTYFLFLTALGTMDEVVRGLQAGADDYLTKPVNLKALESRLANVPLGLNWPS